MILRCAALALLPTQDLGVQQDTHELLMWLLDTLSSTDKTLRAQKVFQGAMVYTTSCLDVECVSRREQPFVALALQVAGFAARLRPR